MVGRKAGVLFSSNGLNQLVGKCKKFPHAKPSQDDCQRTDTENNGHCPGKRLALANKDIIHLEDGNLVVNNKLKDADRVTIVTLGGTGHEPAISGFVGEGMVDISVAGNVFAAPGPQACIEAIKMADKEARCLLGHRHRCRVRSPRLQHRRPPGAGPANG